MNSNPHHPNVDDSAEQTLRLIAGLPAPEGLKERVHKALRAAPRNGRLLAWPAEMRSRISFRSNSMRTAAAAAIIFVVVGGGWGVYSRVQSGQSGKVIVMPTPVTNTGGFSGAGAIRTPQTLPGPTVSEQGTKRIRRGGEQESSPANKPSDTKKGHETTPGTSQPAGIQHAAKQDSATEHALQPAVAQ
ncbi:MAG: hypothetical protein WBP85_01135 [Terracidiphilus sp.]